MPHHGGLTLTSHRHATPDQKESFEKLRKRINESWKHCKDTKKRLKEKRLKMHAKTVAIHEAMAEKTWANRFKGKTQHVRQF